MDLTSTHPTGRYFIWVTTPTIGTNLASKESNQRIISRAQNNRYFE